MGIGRRETGQVLILQLVAIDGCKSLPLLRGLTADSRNPAGDLRMLGMRRRQSAGNCLKEMKYIRILLNMFIPSIAPFRKFKQSDSCLIKLNLSRIVQGSQRDTHFPQGFYSLQLGRFLWLFSVEFKIFK